MAIVSDTNFLDIIRMLNPQAVVPSRNTVTSDIKTMFAMTKANLRDILRVSSKQLYCSPITPLS